MNVQEAIETTTAAYDSIYKLLSDTEFNFFLLETDVYYQSKVGKLTDAQYVLIHIRKMLIVAKTADEKDAS